MLGAGAEVGRHRPPEIRTASGAADLDAVRALMRGFVAWHRANHPEDLPLIEAYFDAAAFESELAGLPGAYAEPDGRLLLAVIAQTAVGCVALRRVDDGICEMKRMFVPPELHGLGVGRALGEAVVAEARDAGYQVMRLDTSVRQEAAIGLYRSLGFVPVAPDPRLPEDLRSWLVFFELKLRSEGV